jgi:hypothetical protein
MWHVFNGTGFFHVSLCGAVLQDSGCKRHSYALVCLLVFFPGVATHCGYIFHSPVADFSLLVFKVS